MGFQNLREKRRGTRNKTMVIDFRQDPDDLPNKTINVSEERANQPFSKHAKYQERGLEERSFNFGELMSAFKNIEKRSAYDSEYANDTLKRFKSDEETYQANPVLQEKMKIEREIFPKLSENIFFKKRFESNQDFWKEK